VIVLNRSGTLKRKASGGKRAWFLEEESEPRNHRPDVSACLTVSSSRFEDASVINLGMELVIDRWYNKRERIDELERDSREKGSA
jgi:hypothetical protein